MPVSSSRIVRRVLKSCRHGLTRQLGRVGWLRPALNRGVGWMNRRQTWMRSHPFDGEHGVDTAGYVPGWLLGPTGHAHQSNLGYGGCQPSSLRRALCTVPDPARRSFLDIGCGKGRGLIVASELPFRRVIGVEIDPALCQTARANAATIRARFPGRTAIEIVQGDAAALELPPGDLVAFIFNAFSVDLLRTIVAQLGAVAEHRALFVIYQHPYFGHVLDAEPRLRRWFAETVPCEPAERGVGSGNDEPVVCWVSRNEPAPSHPGADAVIEASSKGCRLRPKSPAD